MAGWTEKDIDLDPYKARSFCTDGRHFTLKVAVGVADKEKHAHPWGVVLQLTIIQPASDPAYLAGAMMVTPIVGICASIPVLPTQALQTKSKSSERAEKPESAPPTPATKEEKDEKEKVEKKANKEEKE
eukprot:UN4313